MATKDSPNNSTSTLEATLDQARIFAEIFQREAVRFKYGSRNQLKQASKQLRACLDRIDELTEEHNAG